MMKHLYETMLFATVLSNASVPTFIASDTRKCHDAIADRGAAAVIPPRKNAKPWKPNTLGAVA